MVRLTPEILKQFATPFNENNTLGYKIPYRENIHQASEYLYYATIGCYNAETDTLYLPRSFDHRECAQFVIEHTETDEIEGNEKYMMCMACVGHLNVRDISTLLADDYVKHLDKAWENHFSTQLDFDDSYPRRFTKIRKTL